MSGQPPAAGETRPPWQVLLIGGSSGTGKTTLARALARHYGVPWLAVDDLRLAIQHVTTPAQHPVLHRFFTDEALYEDADAYRDALIAVAEAMAPAVAVVIANHLSQHREFDPCIIEGDGIVPWLAVPERAAHSPHLAPVTAAMHAAQVRAFFVHELDEEGIRGAITGRTRGADIGFTEAQRATVRGSWLYGEWLRAEAERFGLPVLSSRPHDTLLARALALLDG